MSSLRGNGFLLFALFVAVGAVRGCDGSSPPASRVSTPVVNPIDGALRSVAQAAESKEGTAAAILVDTSGSMNAGVRDADGVQRPKIDIARRAALNLVNQFASYAKEHPDQTISLGVYEFSGRPNKPSSRPIITMGPPNPAAASAAISKMLAAGDTPIGDAMIVAKRDLDSTGLSKRHILVITDGENTLGYSPTAVTQSIVGLPDKERASIYFVAFDVDAAKFSTVRDAGGLVLAASNETDLKGTLDYLLTGKILAEQPNPR